MRAEWFRRTVSHNTDKQRLRSAQDTAVSTAKLIFEAAAQGYQAEIEEKNAASPQIPQKPKPLAQSGSSRSFLEDFCDVPDVIPSEIPTLSPKERLDDELRRYYTFEGGKGELLDPLAWWKVSPLSTFCTCVLISQIILRQIHSSRFPVLAKMARDFLAIPATSVSVERTFSKSRRICTDLRSSLRAPTVTQSLLTKVWIRSQHFRMVDLPERPEKRQKTM